MPRTAKPLTAKEVENKTKPGAYADGGNLYLQVAQTGTKSWLLRYMRDGKARKMGLGPFPLVTLAMAREKAIDARRKLLKDIDPIDQRREQRLARRVEKAKTITFKEAAGKYIDSHKAGRKNAKHGAQWTATLETYAYPVIGSLSVDAVDVGLVLQVLEPIWTTKSETASRVRGRIESVLDWATARKLRSGENPARWRGHLDSLLAPKNKVTKVVHHPALPYAKVGNFIEEIRGLDGVSPRALEFAILTAARTGEVVGAKWAEFNLADKMWTIPPERMKASREHRVPLSDRVMAILENLPREKGNEFVFLGEKKGRGLSNMALLMLLRRMKRDELTVHGFRSTFRDWAAEQTAYPNELVEMALAHAVSDKTEAAYRRGDMVDKRRRLMADWSTFCDRPVPVAENVAQMRRAN